LIFFSIHSALYIPKSEFEEKEVFMPRRERDREIARRRKRKKESRKLRAKALLEQPGGGVKEAEKKKPEKAPPKEAPPEAPKETPKPEVTKEGEEPSTQEGQS
jgi:hypothetical protein